MVCFNREQPLTHWRVNNRVLVPMEFCSERTFTLQRTLICHIFRHWHNAVDITPSGPGWASLSLTSRLERLSGPTVSCADIFWLDSSSVCAVAWDVGRFWLGVQSNWSFCEGPTFTCGFRFGLTFILPSWRDQTGFYHLIYMNIPILIYDKNWIQVNFLHLLRVGALVSGDSVRISSDFGTCVGFCQKRKHFNFQSCYKYKTPQIMITKGSTTSYRGRITREHPGWTN